MITITTVATQGKNNIDIIISRIMQLKHFMIHVKDTNNAFVVI